MKPVFVPACFPSGGVTVVFLPDPTACGPAACPPPPGRSLDPTERSVILAARADAGRFGWSGDSPRSRITAFLMRLSRRTGPVHPLADARLERLRLFACMMRRGDHRADAMAEALMLDGFSDAALREAIGLALG